MPEPEKTTLYWPKGPYLWWPRVKYAEGYLSGGERHGRWVFWYKTGQKQLEGEYIKGAKTGTWVKWDENGQKITEGEFLYGKMHGRWTDWHWNGQKALESQWVMGGRDGTWTYWSTDGSFVKTERHDHHFEEDKGYSIHTDLEKKEIVRGIQRDAVDRRWERLVGRYVASFLKPWHISCWLLIFISIFAILKHRTPWRSAALAGLMALLITSVLSWTLDRKRGE